MESRVFEKLELEYGVQAEKHVEQATKAAFLRAQIRALGSPKTEGNGRKPKPMAAEQQRAKHLQHEPLIDCLCPGNKVTCFDSWGLINILKQLSGYDRCRSRGL